jgi:hypothetical protein
LAVVFRRLPFFAIKRLALNAAALEILQNYASYHVNCPMFLGKIGLFAIKRAIFARMPDVSRKDWIICNYKDDF